MNDNLKDSIKIVCVVQARMGSSRLPGKVMALINDNPMLWHILYRIGYSKWIDQVVVATSTEVSDNPIVDFCEQKKIVCFRGSQLDVLDRFYQCALYHQANIIVRITADCPLIDPGVVDACISHYLNNIDRVDYVSNTLKRTYPRGLDTEVFSIQALTKAWKGAEKNSEREHVTPFIYCKENGFRLAQVENKINYSHYRWTVDEQVDLDMVRHIYARNKAKGTIFSMEDILSLMSKDPTIELMNQKVKQKEINTADK